MLEERFVRLQWSCECGVELRVQGEHIVGARAQQHIITCPKCGKEHYLPNKPLRLFYREGNVWHHVIGQQG